MKISVVALTCTVALACNGCVTVTNGKGDKYQLSTNGLNKLNSGESNAFTSANMQASAICDGTALLEQLKQNTEFHDAAYVGYHLEGSKPVISVEKFVQSKTEKFNEFERARRQQAFETYYSEKQYKDTYYVSGLAELGDYDFTTQSFPITFYNQFEITLDGQGAHIYSVQTDRFDTVAVPAEHAEAFLKHITKTRHGEMKIEPELALALSGTGNKSTHSKRRIRYYASFSDVASQGNQLVLKPDTVLLESNAGDCSSVITPANG
ncbi:hypothetical protein [Rheinheimera sp.]|uniref:hypothetical protein n=1 Tax=Rheinheimera sp. TaxID=1869214 RepID=UPI0023578E89|nr:hypothetical protein [Rheinheimera sp.]